MNSNSFQVLNETDLFELNGGWDYSDTLKAVGMGILITTAVVAVCALPEVGLIAEPIAESTGFKAAVWAGGIVGSLLTL